MPKFHYTATTTAGTVHTGTQEAPDVASLVAMLRTKGMYLIKSRDVTRVQTTAGFGQPKIKIRALSMFCNQMASVLRAGVPLTTALDIMRDQVEDKTLKKILDEVAQKLQMGRSLTESFLPYQDRFPQLFINMLEAGEMSGSLDSCLARAGDTFTKQAKINSKIKGAMAYPMVLLSLTLIITIFLVAVIVPMFADTYASAGAELPPPTQFLLWLSAFLQSNWLPVILVTAALVFTFRVWLGTPGGRLSWDHFKLRLPMVGKLMLIISAGRYTRTLSAMNTSGVPLINALEVTARAVGNRYLQKKIETILDEVRMGSSLASQLERLKIFPNLITHMTRLGEESGTLDELLEQTADFYEEESDTAIAALTAMLEPVIILIMGVVIGTVVISIIMPMFNMMTLVDEEAAAILRLLF